MTVKIIVFLVLAAAAGYAVALISGLFVFLVAFALATWALLAAAALSAVALTRRLLGRLSGKSRLAVAAALAAVVAVLFLLSKIETAGPEEGRPASAAAIKSLPYLTWVPVRDAAGRSGVVFHDPERSSPGLNLYNSRNLAEAHLMDMAGEVLHTWSAPEDYKIPWHYVVLGDDGDLFVIVRDRALIRMDWESNVKWIRPMRAHHDLALAENGDIHVLDVREDLPRRGWLPLPVLNDYIVSLSPEGEFREEISFFDLLGSEIPAARVARIYADIVKPARFLEFVRNRFRGRHLFGDHLVYDVFHVNTLGILDRDVPGAGREGDYIFCSLMLDLVGVIDAGGGEVLWSWGPGELDKPHHPTPVPGERILIFDNGFFRGYSRLIEVDPISGRIEWEYTADPPEDFFTLTRGASQRLPGGNTLVVNSNSGHVFEIDAGGDIVWEFFNPEIEVSGQARAAIYRMTRIPEPSAFSWFSRLNL